MPYSIQFRFNKKAENIILHLSEIIEETGVLNLCKIYASIPHIALCIFDEIDLEKTISILQKIEFK